MENKRISDINVLSEKLLPTPEEIKRSVPLSPRASKTVIEARSRIENILDRKDHRLLIILGPCSIHDLKAASEYAERLLALSEKVSETLFLVMRVYFAKPRTSVGWKGLINDPHLDDSFRIDEGLYMAREFLAKLADWGMPTGTEALDPIVPQYIDDLIAWTAIGARTTESQTHRELASGLSTPVGFKNGTDGNIQVAINAMRSSAQSHHFLGINTKGQCAVLHTRGNRYSHIVLRGGGESPNYDSVNVAMVEKQLSQAKLPVNIVIDCSHGNSMKDPALQPLVFDNVINQILDGNKSLIGLMVESNLFAGTQPIPTDRSKLRYGVSITDACIDWKTTESLLLKSDEKLRDVLSARN